MCDLPSSVCVRGEYGCICVIRDSDLYLFTIIRALIHYEVPTLMTSSKPHLPGLPWRSGVKTLPSSKGVWVRSLVRGVKSLCASRPK